MKRHFLRNLLSNTVLLFVLANCAALQDIGNKNSDSLSSFSSDREIVIGSQLNQSKQKQNHPCRLIMEDE